MEPSYISLYRNGDLHELREQLVESMECCRICPRECEVNRLENEKGFCSTGRKATVASYNAHFGEEPSLVGMYGSGTIFISSCNLLCSFCQNHEISHGAEGIEIEPFQMASMMLDLAANGCHNINFVTPTHVIPQIVEALVIAIERGLDIPLVYNSGGYDSPETLRLLDGVFDIYMPDFKFWSSEMGEEFCKAPDYRDVAVAAINEMHRQVGDLFTDENGIAVRGLLLRHLVMPNGVSGSDEILMFIAKNLSLHTYVNLMDQYRPCFKAPENELINRRLTGQEYRSALNRAKEAGLDRLDSRERPRLVFRFK